MNDRSIHSSSGKNRARHPDTIMARGKFASLFWVIMMVLSLAGCGGTIETATAPISETSLLLTPTQPTRSIQEDWIEKVSDIVWVAYSPTSSNPNIGLEATPNEIIADFAQGIT